MYSLVTPLLVCLCSPTHDPRYNALFGLPGGGHHQSQNESDSEYDRESLLAVMHQMRHSGSKVGVFASGLSFCNDVATILRGFRCWFLNLFENCNQFSRTVYLGMEFDKYYCFVARIDRLCHCSFDNNAVTFTGGSLCLRPIDSCSGCLPRSEHS